MAAVVEDVERDLSRRMGVDIQIPIAGDSGAGNLIPVTKERAAGNRAVVRLCGLGRRRTCKDHNGRLVHLAAVPERSDFDDRPDNSLRLVSMPLITPLQSPLACLGENPRFYAGRNLEVALRPLDEQLTNRR